MQDFLALETLLKDRIQSEVPGLRAVLSQADLDGVQRNRQTTPAAHVIYGGYQVKDATPDQARVLITQRWWVVVAVRNVRDTNSNEAARQAAGPLIAGVLATLLGWKPDADHSPLGLETSSARAQWTGGFGYLPLLFSSNVKAAGG